MKNAGKVISKIGTYSLMAAIGYFIGTVVTVRKIKKQLAAGQKDQQERAAETPSSEEKQPEEEKKNEIKE